MESVNSKKLYLVTCISCVVLLLFMCFFGINNSLKGTRAAKCIQWGCSDGVMDGNSCRITVSELVESTTEVSCQSTNCCSAGEKADCRYDSSNMQYFCTCTKTSYKYVDKFVSPVCVEYEKEAGDENACYDWTKADTIGKSVCGEGNYSLTLENGTCYKYSCKNAGDCYDWTTADAKGKSECGEGNYSLTLENSTCYRYSCKPAASSSSNSNGSVAPSSSSSQPSSSVPSSSSQPSSSSKVDGLGNVTDNSDTGDIAIFLMWVIGLAVVVYSIWYFKRIREN